MYLVLKYSHEFICRDARFTAPLLEFRFEFVLPRLRKERLIELRDSSGRIIKSQVPELSNVI